MDDTQEDSKYPPNYGLNRGYTQSRIVGKYADEDDDEAEEDDEEEQQEQEETNVGDNEMNGSIQQNGNGNQYDDDDDDDDNDDDDNDDDDGDDHSRKIASVNFQRHPKKRKLKSLLSSYEIAPRVTLPLQTVAPPKSSFGGRNTLTDWSEHETFVLLDAWGERFLQCGRKSLRSEEWQEVADRVSLESKIERTDSQCRNRLDTLKKKYKKEKASFTGSRVVNTKWVYYKKIDMLLSGENIILNPSVKLNTANGVDDMRDSGGNSDSHEGDDDSDLLPPKKLKSKGGGGGGGGGGGSFRLLAESINKFSEIYEKIENGKIQQMIELEKMRMEFHKELEMQKRKILDRAQAKITKVRQGDYEENDGSAENVSG